MDIDFAYPWVKIPSMLFRTWLESKRGLAGALAVYLKVPPSFVSKMASGDKPIPVAHMAAIEAYSGGEVTRQEMCPDGWQKIWPELVIQQNSPVEPVELAQAATENIVADLPQGV